MRYRISRHPDTEVPERWLIQKKPFFGKWRFFIGFFCTEEGAQAACDSLINIGRLVLDPDEVSYWNGERKI